MKKVVAGRRNQRIDLYKSETGKTTSGAPTNNLFAKIATVWASVITKQVSEKEAGESTQSSIAYSIAIGWRDISPGWVVLWRGQLLRVMTVDDSDHSRRQKILIAITENGVKEAELLGNGVTN